MHAGRRIVAPRIAAGAVLQIVGIISHDPPSALPDGIGNAIAIEIDQVDHTLLLILEIAGAIHAHRIENLVGFNKVSCGPGDSNRSVLGFRTPGQQLLKDPVGMDSSQKAISRDFQGNRGNGSPDLG